MNRQADFKFLVGFWHAHILCNLKARLLLKNLTPKATNPTMYPKSASVVHHTKFEGRQVCLNRKRPPLDWLLKNNLGSSYKKPKL